MSQRPANAVAGSATPGVAARIRALRIRAGKSQVQLARELGIDIAWYADLERRDEELADTLTIFKAMELASLVGVTLFELVNQPAVAARIAITTLPDKVVTAMKRDGVSVRQLEKDLGFDLHGFLASPIRAATELPIAFFQQLSARLGINWLALIPDQSDD